MANDPFICGAANESQSGQFLEEAIISKRRPQFSPIDGNDDYPYNVTSTYEQLSVASVCAVPTPELLDARYAPTPALLDT